MDKSRDIIAVINVPRILGARRNVDNFNLDGILNAIDKVGNAVEKAGNAVNQAGQVIQTVKDSAGNIKQIVSGGPATQYTYTVPQQQQAPLQAGFSLDPNVMLMIGGSVVAIIVALLITRK